MLHRITEKNANGNLLANESIGFYETVETYQKKSQMLQIDPARITTSLQEDVAEQYRPAVAVVPEQRDHRGASSGALQVA